MFTLANVAALEHALRRTPDCKLIVIDPIGSFLGGDADAHRDNEVRAVLAPVAQLAAKYGAAVVMVAHRRKGGGTRADDTALGSRAFTGIARAVWHLTRDVENKDRRLLLAGKNNLAPEGTGLAMTIVGRPVGVVQWERDPVDMSADDAMAIERPDERPGPEPTARAAATKWLNQLLDEGHGEVAAARVQAGCPAAGLVWRTVQRAAHEMGLIREKNSFSGGYQWRRPKPAPVHDNHARRDRDESPNLSSCHPQEIQHTIDRCDVVTTEDDKLPGTVTLGGNGERPAPIVPAEVITEVDAIRTCPQSAAIVRRRIVV
jgi:hypothetical protein